VRCELLVFLKDTEVVGISESLEAVGVYEEDVDDKGARGLQAG
jgi:hypothetical protein